MSAVRSKVTSFAVAAGAIGVAALLNRACPAPCASCTACAATIVPMGTAVGAVGAAFAGSAVARARARSHTAAASPRSIVAELQENPEPPCADPGGQETVSR